MRSYRLFLMAVWTCLYTGVSGQQLDWSRFLSGDSNTQLYGNSVCISPSGDYVFMAGNFIGEADFDPGPGNVTLSESNPGFYVTKTTSDGSFVWARSFTCFGNALNPDVLVDEAGNSYITGYFNGLLDSDPTAGNAPLSSASGNSDIFIIKLNPDGNFVWSQRFGGTGFDFPGSLAIIGESLYCTGSFSGTVDFDNGPGTAELVSIDYGDIFVLKLDTAGQFEWAVEMGSDSNTSATPEGGLDIVTDIFGEVYVTGIFSFPLDFNPQAGSTIMIPAGDRDLFIVKLSAEGTFLWVNQMQMGNQHTELNAHLAIGPDGSVYQCGTVGDYTMGPVNMDIQVGRYTNQGVQMWEHQFGGTETDQAISLVVDETGAVYVSGDIASQGVDFDPGAGVSLLNVNGGTSNGYLLKLTAAGNLAWVRAMNDTDVSSISCLSNDDAGSLYASGYFFGSVDVDFSPATHFLSNPNIFASAFLLKMDTTMTDVASDVEEFSTAPFLLYPNPTDGNTTLQLQSAGTGNSVTIYNLQGEIVKRQELQLTSTQIDLETLLSGMYLVEVQQNGTKSRQYIIRK